MNTEQEIKQLKKQVAILNQIGQAFSKIVDTDELLQLVLNKTMELTYSDAGSIYLIEKQNGNNVLVFKHALNNSIDTDIVGKSIKLNKETASGYVASTGNVVVVNDMNAVYDFSIMQIKGYNTSNMMIVPMFNIDREIVGVVQLINKIVDGNPQDYTDDDEQLLLSISSQLAVTIDRIQTNAKLERNVSLTRTTLISFFNGMKQAMSTIGEDIMDEQEKFIKYATTDPLTGLLSRKEGLSFLEKQLEFARFNGVNVVVCFIDVNGLKYVNDTFGHQEGDYLLSTFSNVVKNTARENDLIFRYGGDEFVLVLYNINKQTAVHVWNRIQSNLNRVSQEDGKPYNITAAVGYAEYDYQAKQSVAELIETADHEMYINKRKMKALE